MVVVHIIFCSADLELRTSYMLHKCFATQNQIYPQPDANIPK